MATDIRMTAGSPSHPETWNAIVTARGDCVRRVRRLLRAFGTVRRTGFYNVLAMTVNEPDRFIGGVEQLVAGHPDLAGSVAHVFTAERSFDFSSVAEFEAKAREAATEWLPQLAGRSFHVRVHRRGRKGTLISPLEERTLADVLLAAIRETGSLSRVAFDDPDAIVLIETIDGRAGMALRTRDERQRHPLLATH